MAFVPPTPNLLAFEAVARRRSFALAAAIHLFLVRKSRVLRFIYNGRLPSRSPGPAASPPPTRTTPLSA